MSEKSERISEEFECSTCENMLPATHPFTRCTDCWGTAPTNPTTVEVPIKWLEKLIELSDKFDDVHLVFANKDAVQAGSQLQLLLGYIESAKELFKIGVEDER